MTIVVHMAPKSDHFAVVSANLWRRERFLVGCAEEWLPVVKLIRFRLSFLLYETIVVLDELVP